MAVRFILGEAGSGKSRRLLEEVIAHALAHPEQHHVLMVPEQFNLETQRQLAALHPRGAILNIEAVNFGHLAGRVERLCSRDQARVLTDSAKGALLQLAALKTEQGSEALRVYRRQIHKPGFMKRLGSLFAEWDMNGISPDRLEEIAGEGVPPLLAAKLRELSALYRSFKELLGTELCTAEEALPRLARRLPGTRLYEGACLYFDGFTGFTAVQYRIITELLSRCSEAVFVFTLPEGENPWGYREDSLKDRSSLFAMSREAVKRIVDCAALAGQKAEEVSYAKGAPERPAVLETLRRGFLRDQREEAAEAPRGEQAKDAEKPSAPVCLTLTAAANPRQECRLAVRELERLFSEEGLRYREAAVVLGDQESYLPWLEEELKTAGIPYFTDRRAPLDAHPLLRFLEGALEAAAEGLDRDAVLRYLRSGCGPLSQEDCDFWENYLLATGIRGGKALREPFARFGKKKRSESPEAYELRRQAERERAEALREQAMAPLLALEQAFKGSPRVADALTALEDFLETLLPEQKLAELTETEEGKAACEGARELIGSLKALLGERTLPGRELAELLRTGLGSLRAGLLPTQPDQLLIGDISRSRFGAIRRLLLLGFNEGLVPAGGSAGGIITDRERRQLMTHQPELGYTQERALFEERFYLYLLLTKPTEGLSLSWSVKDMQGKNLAPSSLLGELARLFPHCPVRREETDAGQEAVRDLTSAVRVLAGLLREKQEGWQELYSLLAESPEGREKLESIRRGALLYYRPERLTEAQSRALYGETLTGSVTRLERFSACPYAHFLEYGLALEPREELSWEAQDHGILFHGMMEQLMRTLKEQGLSPAELDEGARRRLVRDCLERLTVQAGRDALADRPDREALLQRWQELFEDRLWALGQLEKDSDWQPAQFELSFGRTMEAPELKLPSGGRMRLMGTIDRLDLAERPEGTYLRVVDYKTGAGHSFSLERLWQGRDLQLAAYLDAALRLMRKDRGTVLPGGMYYGELRDVWQSETGEAGLAELLGQMQLTGMTAAEVSGFSGDVKQGQLDRGKNAGKITAETLERIGAYAQRKMTALGDAILQGELEAAPRAGDPKGCQFCEFSAVCRFDRSVPGMAERREEKLSTEDILEELMRKGEQ